MEAGKTDEHGKIAEKTNSTLTKQLIDLLERPEIRIFIEKYLDRWTDGLKESQGAQLKAARIDSFAKYALILLILVGVVWLTLDDKLQGQTSVGLFGLLIGYLFGKKDLTKE